MCSMYSIGQKMMDEMPGDRDETEPLGFDFRAIRPDDRVAVEPTFQCYLSHRKHRPCMQSSLPMHPNMHPIGIDPVWQS